MNDRRHYMTPDEFADLSSDQQQAVWKAADTGLVEWMLWSGQGSTRLYHRAQVEALGLETAT